jgi:pyruvate formate lyase activating enzyme
MPHGLVFNVQRFSLQDGPGIRTTVFLKGCALSCPWCHNPESRSARPQVMVRVERCIGCGACVEACPHGVPLPGAGRRFEDAGACTVCGACVEACPTEARRIAGREVESTELVAEVLRDRVFFDQSGGGVTFSGGEPLRQAAFLRSTLLACREEHLHTAVDTCGLASRDDLLAAAELADLFLYDVKFVDERRHREHTGVGNGSILANLEALTAMHGAVWLRVPVIPGVNDDAANLDGIARLASKLPGVRKICLLPYHRTGESKLESLGETSEMERVEAPAPESMRRAAARFEAVGLTPTIGG